MNNIEHINKQLEFNDMPDIDAFPDPLLHRQLSFIKSGIRILGCVLGVFGLLSLAFVFLVVAEIVGVLEEMA